MQFTSLNPIYGTDFLNTILAAYKTTASGPLIASAKVRLINSPTFAPTPATTIADLAAVECAYSGYAAGGIALTVGAPVNLSRTCQGAVTALQFLATAATPFVQDSAYGYWVDDGTNMIVVEMFPAGTVAPFGSAGAFLELLLQLPQQAPQATQ